MGLKNDRWIREKGEIMISPFHPEKVRRFEDQHPDGQKYSYNTISFGTSSYGYDLTVDGEFKVFVPMPGVVIDPKRFDPRLLVDVVPTSDEYGIYVDIPPHSFVLCHSAEYFYMPRNVLAIILGKSTYARCGLIVNTTPLEPGWNGHVTIELTNSTPSPMRIYVGEGIGQVLFFEGDEECEDNYAGSKYDGQPKQVVLPKV